MLPGWTGEPLIPVQAITSAVFAVSGIVGVALFLEQQFRLAALIPIIASWGWRACSEWLRADYRGASRISAYQMMAIFSVLYLTVVVLLMPAPSPVAPNLGRSLCTTVLRPGNPGAGTVLGCAVRLLRPKPGDRVDAVVSCGGRSDLMFRQIAEAASQGNRRSLGCAALRSG